MTGKMDTCLLYDSAGTNISSTRYHREGPRGTLLSNC